MFYRYKSNQVQVDVRLVLEPELDKVSDDVNVCLRVCTTVHCHRQEKVLGLSWDFRIHNPHFQFGDHRLPHLQVLKNLKGGHFMKQINHYFDSSVAILLTKIYSVANPKKAPTIVNTTECSPQRVRKRWWETWGSFWWCCLALVDGSAARGLHPSRTVRCGLPCLGTWR